ncbi:MAG: flagellar motor protein MotB [Pseudomonadales bacterium]|nr:flagellar motor protein MotB [Pseudomonadales bacterium]
MSAPGDGATQPIIIKRKKVVAHGHHGGAWKVAFADFVTAMMAFFLLLWLLSSTTPEERNAIQGYFQDPSGSLAGQGGGLDAPGANMIGPGGADSGVIDMNNPLTQAERNQDPPSDTPNLSEASDAELAHEQTEREQRSLDKLEKDLSAELEKDDSAFMKLRDQIIIDRTALGLRIQIVDKENRPMFDRGHSELQVYAQEVLNALAPRLNVVPNKLSINGHTDSVAYGPGADYTNWELSADRANSARRALLEGGYPDEKVLTVQGIGASIPRLADKPQDASNRRIVILVLKKEIEEALRGNALEKTSSQAIIDSPSAEPFESSP